VEFGMSITLFEEMRSGTPPPLVPITVDQLHQMIRRSWVPKAQDA
jgi:hypothetical protein